MAAGRGTVFCFAGDCDKAPAESEPCECQVYVAGRKCWCACVPSVYGSVSTARKVLWLTFALACAILALVDFAPSIPTALPASSVLSAASSGSIAPSPTQCHCPPHAPCPAHQCPTAPAISCTQDSDGIWVIKHASTLPPVTQGVRVASDVKALVLSIPKNELTQFGIANVPDYFTKPIPVPPRPDKLLTRDHLLPAKETPGHVALRAHMAKFATDHQIMLTHSNSAFIEMFANWLHHVQKTEVSNFVVIMTDKEAFTRYQHVPQVRVAVWLAVDVCTDV
jgi:hypothetical protein